MYSLVNKSINDGVTIIKVKVRYKKYDVKGLHKNGNNLQLTICYNKKQYYIGTYRSSEEARPYCIEAEKHKADGTFLEWYKEFVKRNRTL